MNNNRDIGTPVISFITLFLIFLGIGSFVYTAYLDRHRPDTECKCEFYQDYHQQRPTVLNKRCELDDKGFLMYGDTNVRVAKYVNICDNTNE